MVALPDRSQSLHLGGLHSAHVVLLAILVGAAIIVSLAISGLLILVFGTLPTWLWVAVFASQIIPALFCAGAMVVGDDDPRRDTSF